jgi:hypothetical protein
MTRWLFAAVASVALVAAGLVHGFWTDRWTASTDTEDCANRLANVPRTIGEWQAGDKDIDGQPAPGVAGCLQRRYFSRRLGVEVTLALVNGRPGPVATHTPDVCYGASGYVVEGRGHVNVPLDTKTASAQFWRADAVRDRATETSKLRIYWAWSSGQGWQAPNDARLAFPRFRHPVLHKLYVLRDIAGESNKGKNARKEEPCEVFLQALLPQLDGVLFTSPG